MRLAASHLASTVAQLQHGSGGGAMQLRYEPLRGLVMRVLALPLPLPLTLTRSLSLTR